MTNDNLNAWIKAAEASHRRATFGKLLETAGKIREAAENHIKEKGVDDEICEPLGLIHRLAMIQEELSTREEYKRYPVDFFEITSFFKDNGVDSPLKYKNKS